MFSSSVRLPADVVPVNCSPNPPNVLAALATGVEVSDDTLAVELADGRTIAVPLAWYPRLAHATAEERNAWRLIAGGRGIHWEAIDEDVSVSNLLSGQPSGESTLAGGRWPIDGNDQRAVHGHRLTAARSWRRAR